MGNIQQRLGWTRSTTEEEQQSENPDFEQERGILSKLKRYQDVTQRTNYLELYRLYKHRMPYMIEDYLGINMSYHISKQVPNNVITTNERRMIKNNDTESIKKLIYVGKIEIDDPIDSYSKHTLLHDAVIMNRQELFDFLIAQKANPMLRDMNGYTALLKAAALGRSEMVRSLVEKAGVDPRHKDPYGNTARDKAILYNRYDLVEYLQEMEKKANNGEIQFVNWKDPERIRRSGRYVTYLDY